MGSERLPPGSSNIPRRLDAAPIITGAVITRKTRVVGLIVTRANGTLRPQGTQILEKAHRTIPRKGKPTSLELSRRLESKALADWALGDLEKRWIKIDIKTMVDKPAWTACSGADHASCWRKEASLASPHFAGIWERFPHEPRTQ